MTEVERLVAQYGDLILRVCVNCLKNTDDAEDVCQTVFLKLLTKRPVFENAEHEKAWILRVAINECGELFRKRRRLSPLDEARAVAADSPLSEVMDALSELPVKYSDAFYLTYCEGFSAAETARILGCSEAAVYTRLNRAKKMLRGKLEV